MEGKERKGEMRRRNQYQREEGEGTREKNESVVVTERRREEESNRKLGNGLPQEMEFVGAGWLCLEIHR